MNTIRRSIARLKTSRSTGAAVPPHDAWDFLRFCCRHRTWVSFEVVGNRRVARFSPMEDSVAHRLLQELSAGTDAE